MSAAVPNAATPVPDSRIKRLDDQILGLRDARRLMAEAQRIGHWHYSAGRESSRHTIHAISSAREKIGRDLKKLKAERAGLEEKLWLP